MSSTIITYPARAWLGARVWVAQDAQGKQWFGLDLAAALANVGDSAGSEEAYRMACQDRMRQARIAIEKSGV